MEIVLVFLLLLLSPFYGYICVKMWSYAWHRGKKLADLRKTKGGFKRNGKDEKTT